MLFLLDYCDSEAFWVNLLHVAILLASVIDTSPAEGLNSRKNCMLCEQLGLKLFGVNIS